MRKKFFYSLVLIDLASEEIIVVVAYHNFIEVVKNMFKFIHYFTQIIIT